MTRRRLESVSDTGHVMGLVRDGVKNRVRQQHLDGNLTFDLPILALPGRCIHCGL